MNNKGQSIFSEHMMVLFVVIAAIVAMTTFVQRSFQARIHDARNYMIDSVKNSDVCDANCLLATGNQISHEYEPYYLEKVSDVEHNESDFKGETSGNPQVIGAVYYNSVNAQTTTISRSIQLPPGCADGAKSKPSDCIN